MILSIRERYLSFLYLRMERLHLRLLRHHLCASIARVLFDEGIADLYLISDLYEDPRDQAGDCRSDAHIFIHALHDAAGADRLRKGRMRRLGEWRRRRIDVAQLLYQQHGCHHAEDCEIDGDFFKHIARDIRRGHARLSPGRPPFPQCGRQMKRCGCRE